MSETLAKGPDWVKTYDDIMQTAWKQIPEHQGILPSGPGGYFFPWEYSPYRANGSTSAESGSTGANESNR